MLDHKSTQPFTQAEYLGSGLTSQRVRDRLMSLLYQQGIKNLELLEVMRRVPRHLFVDEALNSHAYDNTALPIGYGQTISQPYVVAKMTEALLQNGKPEKVLEIGTGCGYQTAVLACLAKKVYTVERLAVLSAQAHLTLQRLQIKNVAFQHGDGFAGWPEHAPYDAIIVTAAPEHTPPALLQQLAVGGQMVIPLGKQRQNQTLYQIRRLREDQYQPHTLEAVLFVPLQTGVA
jgi:protein-L-isoaspartate(D-aspartate) O-methyltransferase